MVETDVDIFPPISYFMTVHVKGEVEGEVEPDFYKQYKSDLGQIWRLFDSKGLQLAVEFNNDDDVPRITNGWLALRRHYKFGDSHHQIFFKYLGKNIFQIIPSHNKITPDNFPTWHTKSRALRKAVTFTITMTDDPDVVPYLTLPTTMGEYLWHTMLDEIFIVGTNGEKYKCSLEYQRDPFVVTISRGWRECVGIYGFKIGDRIQFNTSNIYKDHVMSVRSLS